MAKFGIIGDIDLDNLDNATETEGQSQEDENDGDDNEEMSTDSLTLLTRCNANVDTSELEFLQNTMTACIYQTLTDLFSPVCH